MNARRIIAVARAEAAFQWKRPLFWVAVVLLFATSFLLSTGSMSIGAGDVSVGGKKAWITSAFASTQLFALVWSLFLSLFLAIAGGMAPIRDRELDVAPLLHSSPLSPGEYVFGKFLGVVVPYLVLLGTHVAFTAVVCHLPSVDAEFRGPFVFAHWAGSLLPFGVPLVVFFCGASFWLGARSGRPILVFFVPLAFVMLCVMFVWNWHPVWLDARLSSALGWIDPAGVRWLRETYLAVDRGVEFYNSNAVGLDAPFLVSRVAMVLLGLGFVRASIGAVRDEARGMSRRTTSRPSPIASSTSNAAPTATTAHEGLRDLGMRSTAPGFIATTLTIARVEFHELVRSPGLYLFTPLIVLQTLTSAQLGTEWLGMHSLITPGGFAASTFNTVALLVCLLALFYVTESLERDLSTRFSNIAFATPVRTAALLAGKCLANSFVGGVIVTVAALTGLTLIAIDGKIALELMPFAWIYGLLLAPTVLLFTAFAAMVHSVSGNRYVTYGVGLAALIVSGIAVQTGTMNWMFNWHLWGAVNWSDISVFELDRSALVQNRVLVLLAAVLFVQVAVRFHMRRQRDGMRTLWRLRPAGLLRGTLAFVPIAIPTVGLGVALALDIHAGHGGEPAREATKDYWRQNVATWLDSPTPRVASVDLNVDLFPAERRMRVEGSYVLRGREVPLRRFCVTVGPHFRDVTMRLDPAPARTDEKKLLYAFELERPLGPDDSCTLTFSHEATLPDGISKNGGSMSEFIVPSGVVLTAFGPVFVPMLGFMEGLGVDEDNAAEPKIYPDDHWLGRVEPAFGSDRPFDAHCVVTCPSDFTANFVGDLVADETVDGRRTLEWSAHGVRMFNLIAGRWTVSRGDGVAIHHDPRHTVNIASMTEALELARRHYGEWFAPFPWSELRLSEFPGLASYAQGFPTNITFSEDIGFLGDDDEHGSMGFMVTAHEAAHQWWGNMLTPGEGPGGNVLSEGMAHTSTMLLVDHVRGAYFRRKFFLGIEDNYAREHVADAERSLARVDGSKPGDTTILYDKGGMVGWMTQRLLGRERFLAACRAFIARFKDGPDFPLIEDYVAVLREHAPDPAVFDAFAQQWYFGVVRPEFSWKDGRTTPLGDGRTRVEAVLTNTGTGAVEVEVAATHGGETFADDGTTRPEYSDVRTRLTLAAGASATVVLECPFEPETLVVDPDAHVLMLQRKQAIWRF
ncbi:MAG: hypothetical protein IPH13_22770 [Planctomycetes bacterium]|nr:hypothetical protein [Planctomycetota bacterium]